jgi:hypothetical protein
VKSKNKKKRRRIEILYELLKKLILDRKFEENKLCIIINRENLKQLINFTDKKKRKKEYVIFLEEEEEFIEEKISKNWKTRRKTSR